MDNFEFDLQLFADETPAPVTVELTDAVKSALQGTSDVAYMLCKKDGTVSWKTVSEEGDTVIAKAEVAVKDEAETPTYTRTLTIVAAAGDAVTISGASAADLNGVTVATKATLSGEATSTTTSFTDTSLSSVAVTGTSFAVSSSGVVVGQNVEVTVTKGDDTFIITETVAEKTITVSNAGVVSGLDADDVFTVKEGTDDTLPTTYTAAAASLAVTGDQVGIYTQYNNGTENTNINITGVTVAVAAGKDAVKYTPAEGDAVEVTGITVPGTFTPAAQETAGTKYYAVTVNEGTYEVATVATASVVSGAVGYFKVVTDTNYGEPTATISFVSALENGQDVELLGNVTIDASNLEKVTVSSATDITKLIININKSADGKVTVNNVTTSADVTISGDKTYTADSASGDASAVTYTKTYSLGTGSIVLKPSGVTATTFYYEIQSTADTTNGHGQQICSISSTAVTEKDETKSYFKVVANTAENVTTYTVTFESGTGKAPASISSWANIPVDADGLKTTTGESANTVKIVTTGDTAEGAADTYVIKNAEYGVVALTGTGIKIASVERTGTMTTTLDQTNTVALSTSGTKYYTVTPSDEDGDGNIKVTIGAGSDSVPASGSYFKVDGSASKCTVTYVNGAGVTLSDIGSKITLTVPDGFTNAVEVDITDTTDNPVDYSITDLPAGTVVTGTTANKDTVTYASGSIYNNVNIDLAALTNGVEDGNTVYYAIKSVTNTANAALGYSATYELDTSAKLTEADNTKNLFAIKKSGSTYTISYTQAQSTGIDLATATGGATNINAEGIAAAGTKIEIVNDPSNKTVNSYTVTNVVSGGYTGSGSGIYEGELSGSSVATQKTSGITYLTSDAFDQHSANISLSANLDKVYKVTKSETAVNGVTTYTIGAAADLGEYKGSYFKVTVSTDGTTATLSYVEGTASDSVSRETFAAKATEPINVAGSTAEGVTTIVLTDDTENAISYNVTNIKAGVVVNNASDADTLTYVNKSVLAEGASTITLGTAAGTVYYAVTAGDAVNGIYTCSISTTALTEQPADTENYFTVETVTSATPNTVKVTYHQGDGTGDAAVYDLKDNTVNIDATQAAESLTITAGSGDDSSTGITYKAADLTKGQTLADGGNGVVSSTYATSYALTYTDGTGITANGLALQASTSDNLGKTYYYEVSKSGPSDTGVITYTITADSSINTKPTTADAYFAVTYGSSYITTVTYVNVNGTADYDLSAIGQQITIDAASSTASTIDITDTLYTGSKVDYALTNVGSNVTVEGQSDGDTIARNGGSVTLDGTIALTDADTAYFVVDSKGGLTAAATVTTADNYITVTKSGTNYAISYTPSSTSTAYTLTGTLTVDAKDAAAGKITQDSIGATVVAVTNAAPGTTTSTDEATDKVSSISFTTNFAWVAGTYYLPIAEAASALTLDSSATAGVTEAGKSYVIITVTKAEDGTFTITKTANYATAGATAVTAGETAYTGTVTLVAPSEAVKLDGTGLAATVISGVAKDSVLTNIGDTVAVTTAKLAKGESVSINNKTYTAGAASAITVTNAQVSAGILALSATGDAVTDTNSKTVTLTESSDGVVVTIEGGKVTSITGLATEAEKVTYNGATYIIKGNYIRKFADNVSTWAVAPGVDGNVLAITEWYGGTAQAPATLQVGGFRWMTGTYYVKTSETVTATDGTKSDIEANTKDKYAKIVLSADNTIGSITILQNNASGLPTVVENSTDTITIEASSTTATTYNKGATDTFHVTITGAITGSSFTNMKEGDTVTSAALADDATVSINSVVYTATGQGSGVTQQLTFKDGALQTGTVKVVESATYVLADGSTLTYGTTGGNAQIEMKNGALVAISNLGTNETLTITNGTTETVYTSDSTDGTKITKTVTNKLTNEKSSETITLTAADDNVLAGTEGEASYSYTNSLDWTAETASYGYYKATFNSSTGVYGVSVDTTSSGTMTNGEFYIKAELTPVMASDGTTFAYNTLTLTPGSIAGGVFTADTAGILNGAAVTVTVADSDKALHFANTEGYTVNMTGVPANSELTLKKGDTATTAALTSGTITINGNTYTAQNASAAALTFYAKTASDVRLVGAGTVLVTGELSGMKDTSTEGSTVTYTAKTGVTTGDGADGVTVTYDADGKVTSIKDLDAGETVTTVTDGVTKTYTANSSSADIVTITVTGASTAADNGTFVVDIGDAGANIVVTTAEANKAVSTDSTFNWAGATSEAPATGYFFVTDSAVTVDGSAVTVDNASYGKKLIKASLTSEGALTLTTATIGITGAITDSSTAVSSSDVTALTLAITGAQKVNYTVPTDIALTVTGAGAGSVFGGSNIGADDTITTAALSSGDTLTIGSHLFTAGTNSDTLVVTGDGKVVSGTFSLVGATESNSANTLTAYNAADDVTDLDADDVVSTSSVVTYTAGTDTNGANVVVKDGLVTSITGMGKGEKVVVATTTTTKGSSMGSTVTTTYESVLSGSVYKVTKTVEDAEGKTSIYTKNFANDAQDVVSDSGWTTTSQTTTTKFDFAATTAGSTGYFAATLSGSAYTATIDTQSTATTIPDGSSSAEYYLKVEASQSISGAITISSISLVHLESSGAWTDSTKAVGTLTLNVPSSAVLTLPKDRSYGLTMTSDGTADISNVSALDTITGTQAAAGASLKINGVAYVAAAANNAYSINGDGTVKTGSFTVKDAALTAATSADVVSFTGGTTNDGVAVTFADGAVTQITDLESGEAVTITSADGTKTTYAYDGSNTTKTVVSGGQTEVFTKSGTLDATADVTTLAYGLSSKFDWAATTAGQVGYFEVTTTAVPNTATVDVQSTSQTITPGAGNVFARVLVSGDADKGYTISSVKLLKGLNLTDITTDTTTTATTISVVAPGSITFSDATEDRKYTLAITDAKSGQTFSGLSANDSVATGNLAAGSTITVNNVTYTNAVLGTMTINGNGKAKAGQFALTTGNAISIQDGTDTISVTTTKSNGATVTVAADKLKAITKMDAGDTVVVTTTSASGVVTKETYVATAADDGILITKTTLADGATTVATYTAENNGDNILSGEYSALASGNSITGKLDWTATDGSTGYFLAADTTSDSEGVITGLGAVTVAAETKATNLTANQAGNVYLKVSTTYNAETNTATITALKPYQMTSSGALSESNIGSAATFEGTVNITAPTGVALNLDTITATSTGFPVPDKVALNITGAADGSTIVLHKKDTLTTATLTAGNSVTVNNSKFTAGANGALKFTVKDSATATTGAVLADGTVKVDAGGSFTAAGISTADTDDVTVTIASNPAVVTVTNGLVTAISGQIADGGQVTVATSSAESTVYTYDATNKRYNAVVSGTVTDAVTLAALADGATVSIGGKNYTSGAADNSLSFYNSNLKSGVVKLTADGSVTAIGADGTVTTDDITVAYDQAAGSTGNAVVTVTNGKVTSVKGLAKGDTLAITEAGETAKVTFYNMTETGMVKMGTGTTVAEAQAAAAAADAQTAYITSGGDLLSANYIGGTAESALVGQFSWSNSINGRSLGYFAITESTSGVKKATIAEQATESAATAKGTATKPDTKKYLMASIDNSVLTIGAMSVTNNGTTTTTAVLDTTAAAQFTSDDKVTITAPTDTAITYDKGAAQFGVTINKLAAGSTISNLDDGDKVVTNTLTAGDVVTISGTTYVAGAKGTLTFVGEGNATATTPDNTAALLTGTISLNADGIAGHAASALLSGAAENKDTGTGDDIHVSTDSTSDVIVKAANGTISSITGLTSGSVLTWTGTTQAGSSAVLYTVLDTAGTMIMKQEWTDTDGDGAVDAGESATTSYLNLTKAGSDITKGKYADAEPTAVSDLSFTSDKATFGYVQLTGTGATVTGGLTAAVSVGAIGSGNTGDLITAGTGGTFNAVPGEYYLQIKATTATKTGVTTINAVDLMQAGATGKLTAVKSNAKVAYTGTLTIDGTVTATPAAYATFNYALPAASKRDWHINVTNAALGSTFTNLGSADLVQTADTTNYDLTGKTVTVYKKNTTTNTQQLTQVTAKGDGVKLTVAGGDVTTVTGFGSNGETLTVVSQDPEDGLATYTYKATVKNDTVTITRTVTDQDGNSSIATATMSTTEAATLTLLPGDDATYTPTGEAATQVTWTTAATDRTVVADFDWTMDKAATGYFAVKSNKATVTKAKTTITAKNASTNYIAVEISNDGVVKSIKQMAFDTTNAATTTGVANAVNMKETTSQFSGAITITAPTGVALNFDRTTAFAGVTSINEDATTFEIKGAIADSVIANLANGDTVTTAKLAANAQVQVGGYAYTAAVAGALGFAHKSDTDVVTAGTVKLTADNSNTIGQDIIYIYDGSEMVPIQATAGSITVQAATNSRTGATTYTIGDLGENETFTVGEVTYQRSGTTLFKSVDGEITAVYALGSAKTITSSALSGTKGWNAVTSTFYEGTDGTEQKTNYGVVTANLTSFDARYKADVKAGTETATYNYVLDTYVKSGTSTSAKAALNAILVNTANNVWQTTVGTVTYATLTYTANTAIAQAIKVAKGWSAVGSDYADTITGAASGKDFIRGGQGNDSITLSGAEDTVAFNLTNDGQNTVKGYASGKDAIILDTDGATTADTLAPNYDNDFSVYLDTTGSNVYLYKDTDVDGVYDATDNGDGNVENSVMLQGMGNGKAVTINGSTFYFGNGTLAKNKTATTAGTTFTYTEGAYYYGNDSGKNALKVATDKTKATSKTLGDDVTIDLTAVDADGRNLYNNISTIDASTSGNRLVLQAAAAGNTLKGGTYQSTLKSGAGNDTLQGGSGQDVFWFDDLGGNDTVKSYTSGKDAVYLGGNTDLTTDYTVKASGNDVVITKDGDNTSSLKIAGAVNAAKAITVSKDGKVGGESVSYFVGKSGAKVSNAFTYVDGAYYIGNTETTDATSTAKYLDTLKVTGTVKTAPTAKTKIDLSTSQYQSIEAVDASTLKAGKNVATTNMGVDVTASGNGTRFTGTAYDDAFTCGAGSDYIVYKVNQGADTIDSFGVGDVIQLNGLTGVDKTAIAAEIDKINAGTSTNSTLSFAKGGSVKFTEFDRTTTQLYYDSKKGTITGKAIN